jgi:peptidoglycan hydrolase-like protein with peptidoglycan-binding domain
MPKAAPLPILALSILISTSAAGQEASPAPDASAPEQARITTRRQTTLVAEPVASRPVGPNDSFSITRDAQRELQRLGCYDGEINGDWSQSSRAAAERFLDRVNAKLPTDEADVVLLALLQGQKNFVCSHCPPGQMLDPRGRCTPTALLKRSPAPVVTGSLADVSGVPARANDERSRSEQASATTGGQQSQLKPSGYWRRLIWKMDRALGLN